jgi:hypothetical protein
MIHKIEIRRINPDLSERQILVFRIAGTQDHAEQVGECLRTRWMENHPGVPTTMSTTWPRPAELGQHVDFVTPALTERH